ncbi:MAG: tail fiber protein [Saprospiraceae bacterium]|nr:tail fiber protein [Saprospiraceae bacterium]
MDPFLGMIVMFGGNFAPRGWALCDGQLLSISANTALFSILGTTFGGDGRTTFGLPDLRGRVSVHAGNGPGLQPISLGAKGGSNDVTLTVQQIPAHSHAGHVNASTGGGDDTDPTGRYPGAANFDFYAESTNAQMNANSVATANTGGNQSHNNMQPYQAVNYIIALQGVYPSRS